MRKYIEIFKYSLKTKTAFITDYLFSLFGFGIHVFVFNELWDYILKDKLAAGYTKTELVWYIIIAELVTFSAYKSYIRIGNMVKQGDIANMLIKPVDMINYFIMEDSSVIIKLGINTAFAIVLGIVLAGPIKISAIHILFIIIAIVMAVFTHILIQILIGIIAFFTEENKSFYLVIQKLSFFAVFTPIEFYPEIVQKIFSFMPNIYYIYAPAKIFAKFEIHEASKLLLLEFISMVVIFAITRLLYKKGVEKINVNGG